MRTSDVERFKKVMAELDASDRMMVLAYGAAKLTNAKALASWMILSWVILRKRTFVVTEDGDLPAPRVIGL